MQMYLMCQCVLRVTVFKVGNRNINPFGPGLLCQLLSESLGGTSLCTIVDSQCVRSSCGGIGCRGRLNALDSGV